VQDPLANLLSRSHLLYSTAEVQTAITHMASAIADDFTGESIVMLCVMTGAVPITAALMQQLPLAIILDYVHVSRYGDKQVGGELRWLAEPSTSLRGKKVLVVDDIFDEGHTLSAIVDYCCQQEAREIKTAALINKQHQRKIPNFSVDYIGLQVADEYVCGFGMDCEGWGRDLDAIYSLKPETQL